MAPSTAIKWVDQWERTGSLEPRPQGGDHRSHHIEAYAEEILGLIEVRRDITQIGRCSRALQPLAAPWESVRAPAQDGALAVLADLTQLYFFL